MGPPGGPGQAQHCRVEGVGRDRPLPGAEKSDEARWVRMGPGRDTSERPRLSFDS